MATIHNAGQSYKLYSTCFVVFVIPAYALLCEEQLAHLLQKTKIVKEGDELI